MQMLENFLVTALSTTGDVIELNFYECTFKISSPGTEFSAAGYFHHIEILDTTLLFHVKRDGKLFAMFIIRLQERYISKIKKFV